jgi:hypothetical protein
MIGQPGSHRGRALLPAARRRLQAQALVRVVLSHRWDNYLGLVELVSERWRHVRRLRLAAVPP